MSIISVFDKSFLQSLSTDESVWFDRFFLANICPYFYVETLADLGKSKQGSRGPMDIVKLISEKFPELSGVPNLHHTQLCINNLLGYPVPMNSRIPIDGGRPVKSRGESGVVFEESPEAAAFSRWQNGKFYELEREYARGWREALANLDMESISSVFKNMGINGKICKSLIEAKTLAESLVKENKKPFELIKLVFLFLDITPEFHEEIIKRWSVTRYRHLTEYAPFAAHVLTVELFFQIALAASHISSKRPSNRIDIAYLYYLPFCQIFISGDKLHRKCAPLFMRKNQEFVWGPDLKDGLKQLNAYYSELPENIKDQGIMSFASKPPKEGEFFVSELWDRHQPGWRNQEKMEVPNELEKNSELVKRLNRLADAPQLSPHEIDFDISNPDSLTIKHKVRKKKGSWYQVPKDMPPEKSD